MTGTDQQFGHKSDPISLVCCVPCYVKCCYARRNRSFIDPSDSKYPFCISLSLILDKQLPLCLKPPSLFATLKRILLIPSRLYPHHPTQSLTSVHSLAGLLTAHPAWVNRTVTFEPISHLGTSDQIRGWEDYKLMLMASRLCSTCSDWLYSTKLYRHDVHFNRSVCQITTIHRGLLIR